MTFEVTSEVTSEVSWSLTLGTILHVSANSDLSLSHRISSHEYWQWIEYLSCSFSSRLKSLGRNFIFFFAQIRKIATVQSFLVDLSRWTGLLVLNQTRLDGFYIFTCIHRLSPFSSTSISYWTLWTGIETLQQCFVAPNLLIFTVQYMLFFRDKPKFNFSRFMLFTSAAFDGRSFICICNR